MLLCPLTSREGELRDKVSLWESGLDLARSLLLRWSSLVAVSGRLVPALYFFTSDYYTKRRTVGKKDTSMFPCSRNPLSAVNIDVFRKIAGASHMTSWVSLVTSLIPKLKSRWKERINCRVVFQPPCTLVGVCACAHTLNNKKPRVKSVRLSSDFSNNNKKMPNSSI